MLNTIPKIISFTDDHLQIEWKDDCICAYPLLDLRRNCPCAVCKGGHGSNTKTTTDNIKSISLISWKKVGRYALCLNWSDGHDKGIYTYDNLREQCDRELKS